MVVSPDEKYAIIIPGSLTTSSSRVHDSLPHTKSSLLLINGETLSVQGKCHDNNFFAIAEKYLSVHYMKVTLKTLTLLILFSVIKRNEYGYQSGDEIETDWSMSQKEDYLNDKAIPVHLPNTESHEMQTIPELNWSCDLCTYENNTYDTECIMCDSSKSGNKSKMEKVQPHDNSQYEGAAKQPNLDDVIKRLSNIEAMVADMKNNEDEPPT